MAHPQPSVEFLGSTNGPIHNFWQHVPGGILSPYLTISSISLVRQLTHPEPLVEFFGSTNGPICNFWQHVSGTTLGPYDTIGSISISKKVGPSATIGRILWQHQWAYSQLLAACLWKNIGPIQDHWQNLLAAPADPLQLSAACLWNNIGPT